MSYGSRVTFSLFLPARAHSTGVSYSRHMTRQQGNNAVLWGTRHELPATKACCNKLCVHVLTMADMPLRYGKADIFSDQTTAFQPSATMALQGQSTHVYKKPGHVQVHTLSDMLNTPMLQHAARVKFQPGLSGGINPRPFRHALL